MNPLHAVRLYGILDLAYVEPSRALAVAGEMLEGGCGALQLRAKAFEPARLRDLALSLAQVCREAKVPFIVNDHPRLAAEAGADGVHLGQEDWSVARAREVFGGWVGQSTHSLDQAVAAEKESADYIGYGPLFATATKPGRPPVGLGQVADVHLRVRLPVFCIGGIHLGNLRQVLEAGARRVVMVSALLQSAQPRKICEQALEMLKEFPLGKT